jgi:hypothetical protein
MTIYERSAQTEESGLYTEQEGFLWANLASSADAQKEVEK